LLSCKNFLCIHKYGKSILEYIHIYRPTRDYIHKQKHSIEILMSDDIPKNAESTSKKQKRVERVSSEYVWIFIIEATTEVAPIFHMIEINKQTHKEIYKDLKNLERENVEIRMDFYRNLSPFVALKSGNYSTQKHYTESKEYERWVGFCYECTHERTNIIKLSEQSQKSISNARFSVVYSH